MATEDKDPATRHEVEALFKRVAAEIRNRPDFAPYEVAFERRAGLRSKFHRDRSE